MRTLGFNVVARAQQPIRDGLEKVMSQYADARNQAVFGKGHPIWNVFGELQQRLRLVDSIQENSHITVKWSVGQGNWTKVPWIALMDDRETNTTQRGVYCVFLFRQDMTGVYLTLAQGVTEPRKQFGGRDARQFLNRNANEIRAKTTGLRENGFRLDDDIQLNADAQLGADYEDSVIAYKLYEKGAVPDDDTIEADIDTVLNAYAQHLESTNAAPTQSWLFQANPQYYDLESALKTLNQITWLISSYKAEIHKGSRVYLWESGPNAGILAKGTIVSDPAEMHATDSEQAFTRDESYFAGLKTRVLIQIDNVLKHRLTRKDLLQDEILKSLAVIRFSNATNFKVTEQEASRIEELIRMQDGQQTVETPLSQLQKLTFLETGQIDEISSLLSDKKQIIFEGPPGSGKTHVARWFARYFAGLSLAEEVNFQVRIIQFHQSYGYEDFVEGIRPESISGQIQYNVLPGIFKRLCKDAMDNDDKKFVLIIDEMNRGNISRIFGELLLLLEYRNLKVELPFQKDGQLFSIPDNIYLIGTMNTTDRSLAQIDYALRRRFYFYRLMPVIGERAPVLEKWLATQASFSGTEREGLLNLFLELNRRIRHELGEHFQVGHSYLMKPDIHTAAGQKRVWDNAIMPLLEEYFYNRRDRASLLENFSIQKLLNAAGKSASA